MKCENCGAEMGDSKFCSFCGSQITYNMRREQEQVDKQGCPKCGSSNIEFQRETQGEINNYNSKYIIKRTVGFCKDCGYTWCTDNSDATAQAVQQQQYVQDIAYQRQDVLNSVLPIQKSNNSIGLWVLGWVFFFPAPIMVLVWRKQNKWSKGAKIAFTVIFWLILIGISSRR